MAGSGLLDRLSFKAESDSEFPSDSYPETSLLSEFESEPDSDFVEPDPAPKRPSRAAKPTPTTVTTKARKEVRETIEALVDLPIELWKGRDPHCAGVAEEQRDPIVEAFVNFVCKRPAWVAAVTDMGMSADWLKLIKATYPLVMAIVAHHVTRTVKDGDDDDDDLSAFQAPRIAR